MAYFPSFFLVVGMVVGNHEGQNRPNKSRPPPYSRRGCFSVPRAGARPLSDHHHQPPPFSAAFFFAADFPNPSEKDTAMTCWRINPDSWIDQQVHQLCIAENRSTSNMLIVLIKEAISARRSVQPRSVDHDRLVALMRATPADTAAS